MTIQRRNPARLLATLGILSLCLVLLFGVVLPPLNGHAVERHASDAVRAYNYVRDNGGEHNCWQCRDGRLRYICAIDGSPKNLFAVVVLSPAGEIVTSFICRQDYAKSQIDNGENPWRFLHP